MSEYRPYRAVRTSDDESGYEGKAGDEWPRPAKRLRRLTILAIVFALLAPLAFHFGVVMGRHQGALLESPVPNIAHFVHLLPPGQPLRFDIKQFLAYYSVHHHQRPESIFIYVNQDAESIDEARTADDAITRSVFRIPGVEFRYVPLRGKTASGMPFTGGFSHESDFIRTRILVEQGGFYMDEDTYLIRSLQPLRETGYRNIIARQFNGQTGCGMLMASPNSRLMRAYHGLQERVYDGSWGDHAIVLLDKISRLYEEVEKEVLPLNYDAFFPFTWELWGLETIFKVHTDVDGVDDVDLRLNDTVLMDLFTLDKDFQKVDWRWNWSQSWTIHGYFHALDATQGEERRNIFGPYGDITLDYLLARNSNFARAVYPALRDALDSGILTT